MYNNKIDFFAPKSWDSSLQKHNSNFPTGSLPEPDFDCISENVLETWQKDNKTFKKTGMNCIELGLSGKLILSMRKGLLEVTLENIIRESIFREDLFLYN